MKKIIYILLTAICIAACSEEDIKITKEVSQEISFSIGFSNEANMRVTTDEQFRATFDQGDEIGIFIYKRTEGQNSSIENNQLYVNNKKMTYNGSSWQLESPIYYADDGSLLDIYAYYPYREGATATAFRYNASDEMLDLLAASALGIKEKFHSIPLNFSHLLSLIHITVDKTDKIPNLDATFNAFFHGIVSGEYNLSTKEINKPREGIIKMTPIGLPDTLQRTYRAWIPAQQITSGMIFSFVQTSADNEFSVKKEATEPIYLLQGQVHKSEITLDREIEKGILYKLYDSYPKNGTPIGLVVKVEMGGRVGIIISLNDLGPTEWSEKHYTTRSTDKNDGISNKMRIESIPNWENDYPAFSLCTSLGPRWYLPAYNELKELLYRQMATINSRLLEIPGGSPIDINAIYLSSTEVTDTTALTITTNGGHTFTMSKEIPGLVRAFYEF